MKLPNHHQAYVPQEKLVRYLLSETHPIGRHKRRVLRRAGFDACDWGELDAQLLQLARSGEVVDQSETVHGVHYVVDGFVGRSGGSLVHVRTVWIIDVGSTAPRFGTLYPKR